MNRAHTQEEVSESKFLSWEPWNLSGNERHPAPGLSRRVQVRVQVPVRSVPRHRANRQREVLHGLALSRSWSQRRSLGVRVRPRRGLQRLRRARELVQPLDHAKVPLRQPHQDHRLCLHREESRLMTSASREVARRREKHSSHVTMELRRSYRRGTTGSPVSTTRVLPTNGGTEIGLLCQATRNDGRQRLHNRSTVSPYPTAHAGQLPWLRRLRLRRPPVPSSRRSCRMANTGRRCLMQCAVALE